MNSSFAIGRRGESLFRRPFDKVRHATPEEDMEDHWDLRLYCDVDIKTMKKVRRGDEAPDENINWLEIKNVHGKLGWLYGKADYFAFETLRYWIVVERDALQAWVKDNIYKEFVEEPSLYKLYQRRGRSDVITLISTHDLYFLSTSILAK